MNTLRLLAAIAFGAILGMHVMPAEAVPDEERIEQLEADLLKAKSQLISLKSQLKSRGPQNVPVVRVVDGDTVIVRYAPIHPLEERVTLVGVQVPKRGKDGHRDAKKALEAMLSRKRVTLEFEPKGSPKRSLYGSLSAYLKVGSRNLNVELVRQGWSRFQPPGEGARGGRYGEEFRAAEAEARERRAGLWQAGGPPAKK